MKSGWIRRFAAIGYRHLDVQLAQDALSAVTDAQLPDGQIAISATPYKTGVQRTQPPVLAWSTQKSLLFPTILPGLAQYTLV